MPKLKYASAKAGAINISNQIILARAVVMVITRDCNAANTLRNTTSHNNTWPT